MVPFTLLLSNIIPFKVVFLRNNAPLAPPFPLLEALFEGLFGVAFESVVALMMLFQRVTASCFDGNFEFREGRSWVNMGVVERQELFVQELSN
jgi:hypothetical protein